MAGIYIHIPFCSKACHYCNFHFSTSLHRKAMLLQALEAEIHAGKMPAAGLFQQTPVDTLYFGGGTPSLLDAAELGILIQAITHRHHLDAHAEITLEANPDDITPQKAAAWAELGINRLSIGIQSFRQQDLDWMNRAHSAAQAAACVKVARAAGITNISIDLMYGTPGLTHSAWKDNLQRAFQLGVQHLSCYALTVEAHTALHHFIQKGKIPEPDEELQAQQFEILQDELAAAGWEHYEISNSCLPGFRSRHNTGYWKGTPYLGYGPSAHSYDGHTTRWMGVANNTLYTDAWLQKKGEPYAIECLSLHNRINEKIMTGLRSMEGLHVDSSHMLIGGLPPGKTAFIQFELHMQQQIAQGWCLLAHEHLMLTRKGKLHADAIASALFMA